MIWSNVNIKITLHLRIFTFLHCLLVLFFSILKNNTPVGSINWYHSSFWALWVDILMKAYAVQNSTTVMYIFYELLKEWVERLEKRTERVTISNTNLWRKGCWWVTVCEEEKRKKNIWQKLCNGLRCFILGSYLCFICVWIVICAQIIKNK